LDTAFLFSIAARQLSLAALLASFTAIRLGGSFAASCFGGAARQLRIAAVSLGSFDMAARCFLGLLGDRNLATISVCLAAFLALLATSRFRICLATDTFGRTASEFRFAAVLSVVSSRAAREQHPDCED
jgi:hypothetical protein